MGEMAEDRVFDERSGGETLFVAAGIGVAVVRVSGDRVGGFAVARRCSPRDVAAADGTVAVATDEDVLVARTDGGGDRDDRGDPGSVEFEPAGFGPAVAVGVRDAGIVAAGPDGRVAGLELEADRGAETERGGWRDLGTVEGVNAIDGDLIAADGGVHRLADGLPNVGLSAVWDVSAAGVPLAAAADGLYALGNGWMDALEGDFRVAASDGERAHAASTEGFFERVDGEWTGLSLPAEPVVDVAYGSCPYAITPDGTLLVDDGEGWRSHALGLDGAVGIAHTF